MPARAQMTTLPKACRICGASTDSLAEGRSCCERFQTAWTEGAQRRYRCWMLGPGQPIFRSLLPSAAGYKALTAPHSTLDTRHSALPWDVKHILKLIVMSATYRQSATADDERLQRDPYNRLLARGPRFRMDAEMIRDQALGVSGLLNPEIGGPSVYPV